MKLYALVVNKIYEDHAGYESGRWTDERVIGWFYSANAAKNARKTLFEEILKDDKRFRRYMWDGDCALVEHYIKSDGTYEACWYDTRHGDEFSINCSIREYETGKLYKEAL